MTKEPWRKNLTREEAADLTLAERYIPDAKKRLTYLCGVRKRIIMRARARMLRSA